METLPIWWRQESFREFREVFKREREGGEILIFVGSGLSINAGLPNWPTLLDQLAGRWAETHPANSTLLKAQKQIAAGSYPAAGDLVRKLYHNDHEFRQALQRILTADPTELHRTMADLPWKRIITTNYDRLIETVCPGVPVFVPSTPGQIDSTTERLIFKIHGDIGDPSSAIVIGKSDYDHMYKSDPQTHVRLTLQTLIRRSKLILFIGYGHRDPYFQDIWRFARLGLDEVKNAFALVPIEGMPDEFENHQRQLDAVGVRFIAYSAHDNYAELLQLLTYLKDPVSGDRDFARIQSVRRPTVVMVYCGGTIGADDTERGDEKLTVSRQGTRYSTKLEHLKRRLKNWYGDFYNAGHDLHVEIEWEILPVEWQIFSENATPEYWAMLEQKIQQTIFKYMHAAELIGEGGVLMPQAVLDLYRSEREQHELAHGHEPGFRPLDEKQFITDISNRLVLGIVMLVGTDTLAYSAAALSCGLQYLPCSVVITGSNQPPSEKRLSVHERSRFFASSDAWRNLMTAMYFLQTFGYSLTEVFVCFGDTVHHGVNLRKVSAESLGPGADVRRGGQREPFTFRNLTFRSQYMFKMIDGMFCNNYYPRHSLSFAAFVGQDSDEFHDLRHVRDDLLGPITRELRVEPPSTLVWHVKVTPAFPRVTLEGLPPAQLPRIVLVEGYVSGTYPSSERSHFARLMEELRAAQIPLVLTAPYGIQGTQLEYDTEDAGGTGPEGSVSHLYDVIEETALPLLAHLVGRISPELWDGATTAKARLRLVEQKIDDYFTERPNILTREFIGITEPDKQVIRRNRIRSELREVERPNFEWNPRFALFEGLRRRLLNIDEGKEGHPGAAPVPEDPVTLTRGGFLSTIEQIVRPYQQIGAGPDGFSTLSRLGFEVGLQLVGANWAERLRLEPGKPVCTVVLHSLAALFAESGIADVLVPEPGVEFSDWEPEREDDQSRHASFRFPLTIRRHDRMDASHEKYAIVSFSPEQGRLWETLRSGLAHTDASHVEHERRVSGLYRDLLVGRWQNGLSGVEWALVGVFKGAACGLARAMRFGSLAVEGRMLSARHAEALGQAVTIHLEDGSQQEVRLRLTYNASIHAPADTAAD